MKLIAIGDVHGDWDVFNEILEELHLKYYNQYVNILQCGDFGIWPRFVNFRSKLKIPDNIEIHFCPGNHEDWKYLEQFGYKTTQIIPGLFYHPFGSILEVEFTGFDSDIGKKTIMFCGGADSYDKSQRKAYIDWFPEERITPEDMRHLPETNIDIIISHTAPTDVVKKCFEKNNWECFTNLEPELALDWILNKYRPELWVCGHWHTIMSHAYYDYTDKSLSVVAVIDKICNQKHERTPNLAYMIDINETYHDLNLGKLNNKKRG